jgi:ABC-type lipoprotein release transport system permease subunit
MGKIIGILGAVLGVAGAALGIYAAANPQAVGSFFMSPAGRQLLSNLPTYSIIFFVVVFGLAFGPFALGGIKNAQKKSRLKTIGVKKRVKIISVTGTGLYINEIPQVKMVVETQPGVQAEITALAASWSGIVAGAEIDILVDPSNPTEAVMAN